MDVQRAAAVLDDVQSARDEWASPSRAEASVEPAPPPAAGRDLASLVASPGFVLLSIALAWACTTLTAVTFMIAALSPDDRVVVTVNDYGEMPIEIVAVGAVWLTVTLTFTVLWWKFWNRG
jgi:hypothetical protein